MSRAFSYSVHVPQRLVYFVHVVRLLLDVPLVSFEPNTTVVLEIDSPHRTGVTDGRPLFTAFSVVYLSAFRSTPRYTTTL